MFMVTRPPRRKDCLIPDEQEQIRRLLLGSSANALRTTRSTWNNAWQ